MANRMTFGERLKYARYLFQVRRGGLTLSNAELGRAVGRTGQAVGAWFASATPPPDYMGGKPLHEPLAAFLGVPKDWLIGGLGDAPEADKWKAYVALKAHLQPLRSSAAKKKKPGA